MSVPNSHLVFPLYVYIHSEFRNVSIGVNTFSSLIVDFQQIAGVGGLVNTSYCLCGLKSFTQRNTHECRYVPTPVTVSMLLLVMITCLKRVCKQTRSIVLYPDWGNNYARANVIITFL